MLSRVTSPLFLDSENASLLPCFSFSSSSNTFLYSPIISHLSLFHSFVCSLSSSSFSLLPSLLSLTLLASLPSLLLFPYSPFPSFLLPSFLIFFRFLSSFIHTFLFSFPTYYNYSVILSFLLFILLLFHPSLSPAPPPVHSYFLHSFS